jgi:hypothetical protein
MAVKAEPPSGSPLGQSTRARRSEWLILELLRLGRTIAVGAAGFGRASAVFAFPGIGFDEGCVPWRQHASYPTGLPRARVPPENL